MPKHLTTSESHIPFSGLTGNYTNGILGLPSGTSIPDVATRTIDGSGSIVMNSRVIFVGSSGVLMIASGTDTWVRMEF